MEGNASIYGFRYDHPNSQRRRMSGKSAQLTHGPEARHTSAVVDYIDGRQAYYEPYKTQEALSSPPKANDSSSDD